LPLPTICALNGSVYGGATDLALCCDFRLGVRGSRMFMPAAKFGLHYYPGGLRRAVAALGATQAKRIFLTAQTIDSDEMLRIGFLTELLDRRELSGRVDAYVAALAECEPGVVRSMKRQIDAIAAGDRTTAESRAAYEASLGSDELRRRLAKTGRQSKIFIAFLRAVCGHAYIRIGDPPMAASRRPCIMNSGRADPNLPVDCLRLTGRSDPCPFHLVLAARTQARLFRKRSSY
jgi:hypothetical protein